MSDDFYDEDLGGDGADAWDDGFTVDFSDKEAKAEAFDNVPIPAGWYRVRVTDCDVEESKSKKNPGKPMFALKLTIQDGPHKGRIAFDRWCLWTGALYSVSQAMKAVGLPVNEGSIKIPPAGWWLSKELLVQIKVEPKKEKNPNTDKYDVIVKGPDGKTVYQNATGGYKPVPADWDDWKGHKRQQEAKAADAASALAP